MHQLIVCDKCLVYPISISDKKVHLYPVSLAIFPGYSIRGTRTTHRMVKFCHRVPLHLCFQGQKTDLIYGTHFTNETFKSTKNLKLSRTISISIKKSLKSVNKYKKIIILINWNTWKHVIWFFLNLKDCRREEVSAKSVRKKVVRYIRYITVTDVALTKKKLNK